VGRNVRGVAAEADCAAFRDTDAGRKKPDTSLLSRVRTAPCFDESWRSRVATCKGDNVGKLVVQGKGTREFVEFVLEPEILGSATVGYEAVIDPTLGDPRIGVDESGKGDFFGPLVIAAAYVDEKLAHQLRALRSASASGGSSVAKASTPRSSAFSISAR
jgi:hypothetical protein